MNIDIFKIIKLVFALIEDTELKDNKTFQVVKQVADSIEPAPANQVFQQLQQPDNEAKK